MCGIFGMTSDKNVISDTIEGIKKLEYRGYDSGGIAYQNGNKINVIKKLGELNVLQAEVNKQNPNSTCAISHTRWATHGAATNQNAHPHFSSDKKFAIVHNGIIENYNELKNTYLKEYKFKSQTDTEVVAIMLQHFYDGNVLNTLKTVTDKLKGSYAICVLTEYDPGVIYATKKDNPLVVAASKTGGIISSDSIPVLPYCDKMVVVNNNEFVKIKNEKIIFYDSCLNEISKKSIDIDNNTDDLSLNKYSHYMLKEIYEVEESVKNTLKSYATVGRIYENISKQTLAKTKEIIIVGCGTAYHAGLLGKHIIEKFADVKVNAFIASEFRYSKPKLHKDTLAIFVSQSGETADTIAALKLCKQMGIKTLSIVNVVGSTITYETDYLLYTKAGREIAVASTKAYNSQATLFYLLAAAIKESKVVNGQMQYEDWVRVPNDKNNHVSYNKMLHDIIALFDNGLVTKNADVQVKGIYKKYANMKSCYLIGRQQDYLTALESALKLKEITYINCEAYPSGELKHGTISLIEEGVLVIVFVTEPDVLDKTLNAVHEVKSRGASVLIVTSLNKDYFEGAYDDIIFIDPALYRHEVTQQVLSCAVHKNLGDKKVIKKVSVEKPNTTFGINYELYMPLCSIIPVQLLSYYISVNKGYNPDKPRNLAKSVTVE